MPDSDKVCLWVRPEPFDVGIVPVPPSTKLVHHNLRKLFAYSKNKGTAGFPNLSYTIWKHVACSKLQIAEEIAWQYFETCDCLLSLRPDFRLHMAELRSGCVSEEDIKSRKEKYFIRPCRILCARCYRSVAQNIDETAQLSFIQSNLNDLIDLMVDPESYGTNADGEILVSASGVQALGFLLEGTNNGRTIMPIEMLCSLPKEQSKTGYTNDKTGKTYSLRKLKNWIKSHLTMNPFGLSTCLSLGQRLRGRAFSVDEAMNSSLSASMTEELVRQTRLSVDWSDLIQKMQDFDLGSFTRGSGNITNRILSNCNFAPESNRLIVCNQVCRRTVARAGDPLSGATIKIRRCQYSYLYLLSHLRSVTIEKCHDSTIVLGSVATVVNLVSCENIQLIAVTRKLIINSCRNCTFFVTCQCPPVMAGTNENNKRAPYYTYYPSLEADMHMVGISSCLDLHDKEAVALDKLDDDPSTIGINDLDADKFFRFSIPFSMEGTTKTCPFPLSPLYQEALLRRDKLLEGWHQLVRESNLSKQQRQQLQLLVQSRFQDWLNQTGNQQLLESLAPQTPIKK